MPTPRAFALRIERALASRYFFLAILRVVAIEKARVDLDRQAATVGDVEHPILVLFELLLGRPAAERGRDVEVADDVRRQLLEVVEQLGDVEFPQLVGADDLVELGELLVVERPEPIGALFRMVNRNEMHRADDPVGAHRVDDVLRVGPGARIVVDLGADRESHAAPQSFGNDRRVRDVHAGRLGGTEQVAGLRRVSARAAPY